MSKTEDKTRSALLELGLEDWIPIPEALETPEVRDISGGEDPTRAVAGALAGLVADGKVRLYRGRWDADPEPVGTEQALELLKDPRWYGFHADDPDEERLYFVNVENIRDA